MSSDHTPFARPQITDDARRDPTIWRETEVTQLIESARAGGRGERDRLFEACIERFQFIVRQIVREDHFERVAPSVTEIVHEVFSGDLQTVLDSQTIGHLTRRDFERLFRHKVRQHLKTLVDRLRRRSLASLEEGSDQLADRERVGSDRIPRPEVIIARLEEEIILQESLDAHLDDETRDLVIQRYYFGRTLAELSEQTGLAVTTLHSRIRAAEGKLGRRLVAGLQEARESHGKPKAKGA
jgi:RNA polymerase sigma factor (sigma-70 family)